MITALLWSALAVPPPFPLQLAGEACEVNTGLCSPLTVTLQRNGGGSFMFLLIGVPTGGQLQWQVDPATSRVAFLLGGVAPLAGTLQGRCASGQGALPSLPALRPAIGPTMQVAWELCLTP